MGEMPQLGILPPSKTSSSRNALNFVESLAKGFPQPPPQTSENIAKAFGYPIAEHNTYLCH